MQKRPGLEEPLRSCFLQEKYWLTYSFAQSFCGRLHTISDPFFALRTAMLCLKLFQLALVKARVFVSLFGILFCALLLVSQVGHFCAL